MENLHNKVILITGATSGFGRALALLAAKEGARVIAAGRRKERLAALAKESANIYPLVLDIRDIQDMKKALADLPPEYAAIDVLVNNAGLALGFESFEKQDADNNQQMIDTNISGLVHLTHAVLPGMIARGSGYIVNVSSIAGSYPYPGGNVYGGTKAFVTQFSLNLRADLVSKNIRVTSIEPGMCDTEFSLVRFAGDQQKANNVYEGMTPLSAEDIANTILWCISQPAHVNINRLEVMPTQQAFSPFAVSRD